MAKDPAEIVRIARATLANALRSLEEDSFEGKVSGDSCSYVTGLLYFCRDLEFISGQEFASAISFLDCLKSPQSFWWKALA